MKYLTLNWYQVILLNLIGLMLAGCMPGPPKDSPVTLANPASKNCAFQGGRLIIEKNATGSEYGVCIFEDNRQCEEWALFRKECQAGGIRVTEYTTKAAKYCAITGGVYQVTDPKTKIRPEQGSCSLPDKRVCNVHLLYSGKCPK